MAKLGEKRGSDGKYYMPEMNKGEQQNFEAPAIHASETSSKKMYYFENRKQPGQPHKFFGGNAHVAGTAPKDTDMRLYNLEHGAEVELSEEMAQHIKSKGIQKPIMEENERGELKPTGRFYNDRRFDLHEV